MRRTKRNFLNIVYILLLMLGDIFALFIAFESANAFLQYQGIYLANYFWIALVVFVLLILENIYFVRYDFWSDTKRVLKALFFSFIAVFMVISLAKMSFEYSRDFLIFFFILAAIILPVFKRLAKLFLFSTNLFKIKVKIVANSEQKSFLQNEIDSNWYLGLREVKYGYEIVLISSKNFEVQELQKQIKKFSKFTKDVYVIPYMYFLDFSHANIIDFFNIRLSAIHIENRLLSFKNILIKALFEKVLVLIIFPFLLLLHFLLSFLISISSQGPTIYKQKRLGKDGKEFSCYKYRTMYQNGDQILERYLKEHPEEEEQYAIYHKYKNDPRITSVGKFLRATSLDELPQLYNILRGDMNLIGPRPYMPNEKNIMGLDNAEIILKVKPGITGLWQVFGRNNLTFNQRIELDKWYIQNWSLWMDFVIFMKTIKVVLSKSGM